MPELPNETPDPLDQLRTIAAQVMHITAADTFTFGGQAVPRLRGTLRDDSQRVYSYLREQLRPLGLLPLLRQDGAEVALIVIPTITAPAPSRLWVAILLFALTSASTTWVGGAQAHGFDLGLGLAFSTALLSILLAHELGHFLVARRLGVAVSYPFFIPMPFSPMGTMGAFIAMREPPPDRRALLAIAVAGPLAGMVVALPVLILGLLLSTVAPLDLSQGPLFLEGNSLLYAAIKFTVFGRLLPAGLDDVLLHPVAFAGWAGLLVTGLNLIPAGQLDGGHVLFALLGARVARIVTWGCVVLLIAMGFLWNGWWLWAILIALFGQQRAPLLNELPTLDTRLRLLAILCLIIFVLVFTPNPITIINP